ncbi:hypothetical protein N9S82_00645 [Candidatus Pelagibacter sp.]|nr:hypothetical protein [Candidatus Pelagibacter sp.]
MSNENFICPNCNSKEILEQMFLSIEAPNNSDPWSSVTQVIKCDSCKKTIPAHLGERWDGITLEQAKKEYLEKYSNDRTI